MNLFRIFLKDQHGWAARYRADVEAWETRRKEYVDLKMEEYHKKRQIERETEEQM